MEQYNKIEDIHNKIKSKNKENVDISNVLDRVYKASNKNSLGEVTPKASFTRQVPITEGYDLVGDEWMAKYPTYELGRDNAEFAAQNQSTFDKWTHGITKAGANLGTVVLGNTVGFVNGLYEWGRTGNFGATYDNSFSETLANWNEKLNYQLPNYYTKQEQEAGFFGSLGSANFWANDFLNGLSFTAGTIVSEAMWAYATGGASIAARAGKWGAKLGNAGRWGKATIGLEKTAEGVFKYKTTVNEALKNAVRTGNISTKTASNLAKGGELLNTARFVATSSGNEAGIEAFHYKKEAEENFYNNFEQLNGRKPTTQEIAEFEDNLNDSANAVFGANMAILGVSNMAMFGKAFNIKTPFKSVERSLNKNLFGAGVERTAEGTYQAVKATRAQKLATTGYFVGKNVVTEGAFEEGLQGVTTKTAKTWIESSYDPKYLGKTIDIADAAYKSLAEQYGTKAGLKEVGLGGLIGIFGGGITNLVSGQGLTGMKGLREGQEEIAKGMNTFSEKTLFAQDVMAERFVMNSRMLSALDREKDAEKRRDVVGAHLAGQDALIAAMQFEESDAIGGDAQNVFDKFSTALDAMSVEEFAANGITDIDAHKDLVKQGFQELVDTYKDASAFANAVIADGKVRGKDGKNYNTRMIKDALTHSWVQGKTSNRIMYDTLGEMSAIIGEESRKAIDLLNSLQQQGQEAQDKVSTLSAEYKSIEEQSTKVQNELIKVQAAPKETEGDRVKGNLAQQLQAKLIDLENRKGEINNELEEIAKKIEITNQQQKGYKQDLTLKEVDNLITVEELIKIDENLNRVNEIAASLDNNNPQAAQELQQLFARYNSAQQKLYAYNASVDAIVNGKFELKTENSFLDKMFSKNYEVDEKTREILNYSLAQHAKALKEEGDTVENKAIVDKAYEDFLAGEPVSENAKTIINDKQKAGEKLSKKEQEMFDSFKDTVVDPNKPSKENKKEQEIKDLEDRLKQLEDKLSSTEEMITINIQEPETEKTEIEVLKYWWDFNIANLEVYEKEKGIIGGMSNLLSKITGTDKVSWYNPKTQEREYFDTKEEAIEKINDYYSKQLSTLEQSENKSEVEQQSTQTETIKEVNPIYTELKKEIKDTKKQILSVKKEIAELSIIKETTVQKTELEKLKDRVIEVTKNFKSQYIGADNVEEMVKKKPSDEDINRYRELIATKEIKDYQEKGQLPLDTTLVEEFENLKDKLSKWRLYDSLVDGQDSVADLLDYIQQLETQVDQQETKDEITEEDYKDVFEESVKIVSDFTDYTLGDNTNFPVTSKVKQNGDVRLSHIKFPSILERLPNVENVTVISPDGKVKQNPTIEELNNLEEEGTVVKADNYEFTLERSGRISFSKDLMDVLGFKTYNVPTWSYDLVIENSKPVDSDFVDNTLIGDVFEFNEGDVIELFVNVENDYNKKLLERGDKKEIVDKVVIYVRKNGQNYQILKALDRNESDGKFLELREIAAKTLKKGKSKTIATTKVSYVHLGLPLINVDENAKPKNLTFNSNAVEQVETTGYILDGKLTLSDKMFEDKARLTFVSKLSKNNQGKKIPVVIFKRGVHSVAYPISLVKSPNPQLDKFNAIIDAESTTAEKIKGINDLLIANRIAPSRFDLTKWDEEKLNEIEQTLAEVMQFQPADAFADNYDKNNLVADAEIALDLENLTNVLPSQKINYSLEDLIYGEEEAKEVEMSAEEKEKEAKNIVDRVYNDTLKLQTDPSTRLQDTINEMLDNEESYVNILKAVRKTKLGKELITTPLAEEIIAQEELIVSTNSVIEEDIAPVEEVKEEEPIISSMELKEGTEYNRFNGKHIYNGKRWGYMDEKYGFVTLIEKASDMLTLEFNMEVDRIKAEKNLKC